MERLNMTVKEFADRFLPSNTRISKNCGRTWRRSISNNSN